MILTKIPKTKKTKYYSEITNAIRDIKVIHYLELRSGLSLAASPKYT